MNFTSKINLIVIYYIPFCFFLFFVLAIKRGSVVRLVSTYSKMLAYTCLVYKSILLTSTRRKYLTSEFITFLLHFIKKHTEKASIKAATMLPNKWAFKGPL